MYYNTRHIAPSVVHLATSRDSVVAHETTDDDEVCKLYIILVYFVSHQSDNETLGNRLETFVLQNTWFPVDFCLKGRGRAGGLERDRKRRGAVTKR